MFAIVATNLVRIALQVSQTKPFVANSYSQGIIYNTVQLTWTPLMTSPLQTTTFVDFAPSVETIYWASVP